MIEFHKSLAVHFLSLVKRDKFNIFRLLSVIDEGALDSVQIVGTHGDQSSLSTDVLVELVLEINEAVVSVLVEGDTPQDSADNERSDLLSLFFHIIITGSIAIILTFGLTSILCLVLGLVIFL